MGRRAPGRYQAEVGRVLRIGEQRSGHASHADIAIMYVERTQAKEAIVIYYDRHGTQRDISYTIYTIYMHVNFVSKSTLCWANSLRKVPPNGA